MHSALCSRMHEVSSTAYWLGHSGHFDSSTTVARAGANSARESTHKDQQATNVPGVHTNPCPIRAFSRNVPKQRRTGIPVCTEIPVLFVAGTGFEPVTSGQLRGLACRYGTLREAESLVLSRCSMSRTSPTLTEPSRSVPAESGGFVEGYRILGGGPPQDPREPPPPSSLTRVSDSVDGLQFATRVSDTGFETLLRE